MRTIIDHTVMFLLDKGEGEVVKTSTGYGEVSGVTVHLHDTRGTQVSVSVRRCRKDGTDDARMGNVYTSADIDTGPWVERAREALREAHRLDAAGGHCWHSTGHTLNDGPPTYVDRCCRCGEERQP